MVCGALVKAGVPAGGQARVGCRSSLRRGRGRHDGVRGALAGGVNQRGRPRQVMGVMTCTTRADQGKPKAVFMPPSADVPGRVRDRRAARRRRAPADA
jgi:hypothetical protein